MAGEPPNEPLSPVTPDPYPRVTFNLPEKFVSLDLSSLEELLTKTYSVVKPVSLTFFKLNISPCANPLTLTTLIVSKLADI